MTRQEIIKEQILEYLSGNGDLHIMWSIECVSENVITLSSLSETYDYEINLITEGIVMTGDTIDDILLCDCGYLSLGVYGKGEEKELLLEIGESFA